MNYPFVVIDENQESILKTKAMAESFQHLAYIGSADNYEDGIDLILESQPKLIFLEISPIGNHSNLSFGFINELYRYLKTVPKIIITTHTKEYAFEALKHEVVDYLLKPLNARDFRKAVFKLFRDIEVNYTVVAPEPILFEKTENVQTEQPTNELEKEEIVTTIQPEPQELIVEPILEPIDIKEVIAETVDTIEAIETIEEVSIDTESDTIEELAIENPESTTTEESTDLDEIETTVQPQADLDEKNDTPKPLVICVKSYGDYRYIDSGDILYFEADNNSTDIHLNNGEMITAFKTLKHFENVLPQNQFLRIHNSYIINTNQVSRIHTGNTVCYIKNSTAKLPFSKSYKENVDLIIQKIAGGNYLEI